MKSYPDINYRYRPSSYWKESDPLQVALRNVKGELRRRRIRQFAARDRLEEIEDGTLVEQTHALESLHPWFLGGEYLPGYRPGEVEIARVVLESVTMDVISIRARPLGTMIGYRVVDEYESEYVPPFQRSKRPLTLARLIAFIEGVRADGLGHGLALSFNIRSSYSCMDPEKLRQFTSLDSTFYYELKDHYEHFFDDWMVDVLAERAREEEQPANLEP